MFKSCYSLDRLRVTHLPSLLYLTTLREILTRFDAFDPARFLYRSLSFSLSLSLYIYIYIYTQAQAQQQEQQQQHTSALLPAAAAQRAEVKANNMLYAAH